MSVSEKIAVLQNILNITIKVLSVIDKVIDYVLSLIKGEIVAE